MITKTIVLAGLLIAAITTTGCMGGMREMHESMMHNMRPPTAREILDRRYAIGEISREQYQRMRKDIEQ